MLLNSYLLPVGMFALAGLQAAVKPATTAVRRVILVNLCFVLFRYLKIVSSQIIQINTGAIIHELKFNLRESV